jgi:hypothetical protein
MTEYRCNLEDGKLVASRIFETGMKKFGTDVAFVLAHLSFLLTVNDENSTYLLRSSPRCSCWINLTIFQTRARCSSVLLGRSRRRKRNRFGSAGRARSTSMTTWRRFWSSSGGWQKFIRTVRVSLDRSISSLYTRPF